MVELLEDIEPDEEIISACNQLKKKGFQLALDDFVYAKKFDDLIQICDIIKVDFRLTSIDVIEHMVKTLSPFGCRLLAEKIENYEEFNQAVSLGFEYFQGYFFCKPEIIRNKDLSASQITLLQLIARTNESGFDIDALEKLVSQDVAVSYKLINYLNSAHFNRLQPIKSLRQAISFLGENGFKLFVSLVATSKLAAAKPNELVRMSIIRARFLELIGRESGQNASELFLLGLFSLIDAMLDKEMKSIVEEMSLSENLHLALVGRQGELYAFLRLVESYEVGNWVGFQYAQKRAGVENEKLVDFYLEAIEWADSFTRGSED